jgi:hypothetical protein
MTHVFTKPRYSSSGNHPLYLSMSTSNRSDINLTAEILQCYNSSSSALIDQWINQLAHIGKPTFTENHTLFGALGKSLVDCFAQAKGLNVTSTTETTKTHIQPSLQAQQQQPQQPKKTRDRKIHSRPINSHWRKTPAYETYSCL